MKFTGERYLPDFSGEQEEMTVEHLHRYNSVVQLATGKKVLDIACGEGYGSAILAKTASAVTGIDIDAVAIEQARLKYKQENYPGLQFKQGDLRSIPAENEEFDLLISFESIEHIDATAQLLFLKEIKRVLTNKGIAVISTPDKANYSERYNYVNPFHINELNRQEFLQLMSSYFTHVVLLEQGFEIVSIIAPVGQVDPVINHIHLGNNKHENSGKYLIAIASDHPIDTKNLTSIIIHSGKNYLKQQDRILELQDEVEKLSEWGVLLDNEKLQQVKELQKLNDIVRIQSTTIEREIEDRNLLTAAMEASLQKKDQFISELSNTVLERESEVERMSILSHQQQQLIEDLRGQLAETQLQVTNSQLLVEEKNNQLTMLTAQKEKEFEGLLKSINELEKQKTELEKTCSRLREEQSNIVSVHQKMQKEYNDNLTAIAHQLQLSETQRNEKDRHIGELQERNLRQQTRGEEAERKIEAISRQYDQAIAANNNMLVLQSETLAKLSEQSNKLKADIAALSDRLNDKSTINESLVREMSMLRSQFNEVNDQLLTIYDSDGWKLLKRYYRLKGKILPEGTRRYNILRRASNFITGKNSTKPGRNPEPVIAAISQKIAEDNTGSTIAVSGSGGILPFFNDPVVSIIIPVYNAWEMNRKCIQSIIDNTTDVSYEVIIADDCSTDETKTIAEKYRNIIHIRNEKNLGFLLNCNHAAGFARGKYIHFLNNDTEVKKGWLSALIMLMQADPAIGMTGSKLIYPDGRLQEAGGIIWKDGSGWNFGHRQDPEMPEFNYVKEVDYLSGASIMIRSDIWKAIGGFDTRFVPAYCEDSDLSFEIRKRGYKVVYQPLSEVIHYEGYSHGSDEKESSISNIKRYQAENNKKFFEKWKDTLEMNHYPNAENVFRSRDRTAGKKTMLMIDHYVPQFDKDAGSKTTFQCLELFSKMGLNIKFLGENFYRHEPYTTALQQRGIEVLYGPWYRDNWQKWFLDNKEQVDYIYLNRPHISVQFIDFFKKNSTAQILYYGHDLHFLREQKRYELEKDPEILTAVAKWKEMELSLFDKADIILTPSVEEKQIIHSINPAYHVEVIRPYIYKEAVTPVADFSNRKDILFVGGFGHLPNVDAVEWFISDIWPAIQKADNDMHFIVAGSNPPEKIRNLASDRIIIKGYVSDQELENLYAKVKIVVIPLRYGAGVKGKTVEAMRYGVPVVTTSIGAEGLPGNFSFLKPVDHATDFVNRVISVYSNEQALSAQSEKSIQYINENFTEDVAMGIFRNIFRH